MLPYLVQAPQNTPQMRLPDVVKVVERAAPSAAKPDSGLLLRNLSLQGLGF